MDKDSKGKLLFARVMRTYYWMICIIIVDFIALQKIVECYEMKMSVKVFWALIIFLLLWLAVLWHRKEDRQEIIDVKIILSIVILIFIVIIFMTANYIQKYGNSKIEAYASYIGYRMPLLVGITDSENRLRMLEESIKLSPYNTAYKVEYAYKLIEKDRLTEAEEIAEEIIEKKNSDEGDGYAIRGICYYEYSELKDDGVFEDLAYNDLKMALDLGSNRIHTLFYFGKICFYKKKYEEAEEAFSKVIEKIELWGNSDSDSYMAAYSYYYYAISSKKNKDEYDELQEKALESSVKILPNIYAYVELGIRYCEYETPEYDEKAEKCFNNAVQVSSNIYTREWRGWFYHEKMSMPEEAEKDYQYIVDYYKKNELPDDETIKRVRYVMANLYEE